MQRLKSYRTMKEHQQDCELSSVLQNSMSMFGASVMNMPGLAPPPLNHNTPQGAPPRQKLFNPQHPASALHNRGINESGGEDSCVPPPPKTGGEGVMFSPQSPPAPIHGHMSPNSSLPAYMRNSMGSSSRQSGQFSQRFMNASNANRGDRLQNMPSMLRSILREQNIDYENDFYWLSK